VRERERESRRKERSRCRWTAAVRDCACRCAVSPRTSAPCGGRLSSQGRSSSPGGGKFVVHFMAAHQQINIKRV
jgi:hypothetical protein